MIAAAGLCIAFVSLVFNYIQYRQRTRESERHEREMQAERERLQSDLNRKERLIPEFYNVDGNPPPIRISGVDEGAIGRRRWGPVTVFNPTSSHMRITPLRLVIDGTDRDIKNIEFHLRSNVPRRYESISLLPQAKEDYDLYFIFEPLLTPAIGKVGELWLSSSNREDEPFPVQVRFT